MLQSSPVELQDRRLDCAIIESMDLAMLDMTAYLHLA
jgi:hypothetical protein